MKTLIMTVVLFLSTHSFAREISNTNFMADRIEQRIQMINEIQHKNKTSTHCLSTQDNQASEGC